MGHACQHRVVRALLVSFVAAFCAGCQEREVHVLQRLPSPPVSEPQLMPDVAFVPPPALPESADRVEPPTPADTEAAWRNHDWPTRPWRWIVIHHSATPGGNARKFDIFHRDDPNRLWDELGYHFVIGNGTDSADGRVEIGSRWIKQKHGAHCRTPSGRFNQHGVGICLVGDFDQAAGAKGGQPTAAQLESVVALCRFLCREYGVGPQNILGHRDAQLTEGQAATTCPGRNLDVAAIRRAAAGN